MRPAGGYRGAFFGELLLLAVGARRFIWPDADGIQHRAGDALPGRAPGVAGAPGECGYVSAPGQEWRPALRRADA